MMSLSVHKNNCRSNENHPIKFCLEQISHNSKNLKTISISK